MTISYKQHGSWTRYVPNPFPLNKPVNAMFCKRDADGVDWYDYLAAASVNFTDGSAKMTVMTIGENNVVMAVNTDPTFLFPQNCLILEVIGFDGDPTALFAGKLVDLTSYTFTDQSALPSLVAKADIWRRATDAEAETMEQILGQQSVRKQRIFNDAQYIDPTDPEFDELTSALVQVFGANRTAQLLAPSSGMAPAAIAASSAASNPAPAPAPAQAPPPAPAPSSN